MQNRRNWKLKTKPLETLVDRHPLHHLDRFLLIISGVLIFTAAEIADFLMSLTEINSWVIGINIYRFTFLILIFALRRDFIHWLGLVGFRVVYYLLINHFMDTYLGYVDWSLNDTLTLFGLGIEMIVFCMGGTLNHLFIRALIKIKTQLKHNS